jgi:hypothetical protein
VTERARHTEIGGVVVREDRRSTGRAWPVLGYVVFFNGNYSWADGGVLNGPARSMAISARPVGLRAVLARAQPG